MDSLEIIRHRKQFYIQEGKIELRNATDFLHSHCDEWNEECEQTYRNLLNCSAGFLQKASAMEELEKIFESSQFSV